MRPPGLRLTRAHGPWWRIDAQHPRDWDWEPFSFPRHRFDPPSGRFRVRYAASTCLAAARERFPGRTITDSDARLWLVRLAGAPSSLYLTHQVNLDALGLDDRVSTSRDLERCGRLCDDVYDWWDARPPPLVYRTRTTPSARSMAFTERAALKPADARPLREATTLLCALVLRAGFTVPERWLLSRA